MYTIDRFEEDFALLEDAEGTMHSVCRSALPPEAREGDKLEPEGEGWVLRPAAARAARTEAEERLRRLLNKGRPS